MLIQNGVSKTLEGEEKKPIVLSEAKWKEMNAKVLSSIQHYLSNEILREDVKGGDFKRELGEVRILKHGQECYDTNPITLEQSFV